MRSFIATLSRKRSRAMSTLSDDLRTNLIDVARLSILSAVHATPAAEPRPELYPSALRERRATFVSLQSGDDLRGCCGSLEPHRALVLDVWHSAHAAACADRRFNPVQPRELAELELEISVLSPLTRMEVADEHQLLAQLRPGVDGLYLRHGSRRATFLPKVWANLSDRKEFLRQLKHKAGLAERFWSSDIEWFRYGTESFGAPVATETTCH
jgi:AmmeMemoRadiSam system protein A